MTAEVPARFTVKVILSRKGAKDELPAVSARPQAWQ
jgi:hypothetical protein